MQTSRRTRAPYLAALPALPLMALLAAPGPGESAAYPAKPVEMTVLFGAGSGADLLARKLAEGAAKDLGQPILVVNRTGAAGAPWKDIGEFIAHAKQNPGKVRAGNSGRGSFTHLTGVALENKTGAKLIH